MNRVQRLAVSVAAIVTTSCASPAPTAAPVTPVVISSTPDAERPTERNVEAVERDAPAIDPGSPREAIKAFLRAYDAKRYDILLDFVPDADRAGLTEERLRSAWEGPNAESIQKSVDAIKRVVNDAPIDVQGTRAQMHYGAGTVALVEEAGNWKIQDF